MKSELFESSTTTERIFESIEALFATAATLAIGSILSFIGGNLFGALSTLIY